MTPLTCTHACTHTPSAYFDSWDGLVRSEGWPVDLGEERLHWHNGALVLSNDLPPLGQVGAEGGQALPHHLLHRGRDHLPPLVGGSGWGLAIPVRELIHSLWEGRGGEKGGGEGRGWGWCAAQNTMAAWLTLR